MLSSQTTLPKSLQLRPIRACAGLLPVAPRSQGGYAPRQKSCGTPTAVLRLLRCSTPHSVGDERLSIVKGLARAVKAVAPGRKVHLRTQLSMRRCSANRAQEYCQVQAAQPDAELCVMHCSGSSDALGVAAVSTLVHWGTDWPSLQGGSLQRSACAQTRVMSACLLCSRLAY